MAFLYIFNKKRIITCSIFIILISILAEFVFTIINNKLKNYKSTASVIKGSYVINCFIHIFLLISTYKNSRRFLRPYLILQILQCLGMSVLVVLALWSMCTLPLVITLILLVVCVFNILMLVGVYGYYRMRTEIDDVIIEMNNGNLEQSEELPSYEKDNIEN